MIFYFYLFIYFLPNQVNYIYFLTAVEIFLKRDRALVQWTK